MPPKGGVGRSVLDTRELDTRELDTRCLVIFDCDGVLVDSEVLACEVQARALKEYGLSLTGADVARRFLGSSARDMRATLELDLGRSLPDDHETRCGAELFALFRRELKPVQGIGQIVSALQATDHPRCVASSSSPERIALALIWWLSTSPSGRTFSVPRWWNAGSPLPISSCMLRHRWAFRRPAALWLKIA